MCTNAQRDGHPGKYRWRPLFNAAVWLTPPTRVPCSNAAKTQNPLKFAGVPQTGKPISAASGPKFTILSGHVEEVLLFNKFFFPIVDTCLSCKDATRGSLITEDAQITQKNRHLRTITQVCPALSSQLRHVSTIRKKLVKQQYLLRMSSQYGELRPTNS